MKNIDVVSSIVGQEYLGNEAQVKLTIWQDFRPSRPETYNAVVMGLAG
jgi:hypothetical protein